VLNRLKTPALPRQVIMKRMNAKIITTLTRSVLSCKKDDTGDNEKADAKSCHEVF
jgi:hypothetical protein